MAADSEVRHTSNPCYRPRVSCRAPSAFLRSHRVPTPRRRPRFSSPVAPPPGFMPTALAPALPRRVARRTRNRTYTQRTYDSAARPQLKRLLSGREATASADAAQPANQLRVPEFESPHRASPEVAPGLGVHSPHPARAAAGDWRWAPPEDSGDEELDGEEFGDPQSSRHRAGSVSSADESPDLLEGLSDTSSSDGGGSEREHPVDGWMARDRSMAELRRSEADSRTEEMLHSPQPESRATTSSEPNLAPMLAARKEQYARLRTMQSHGSDTEGTHLPELAASLGGASQQEAQVADGGGSLEALMRLTPSTSMRVQPSSSWTGSSPLLQKLKEISAATESMDEEEDKRRFFARLDASTGLDAVRQPPQPAPQQEALPQQQQQHQHDNTEQRMGSSAGSAEEDGSLAAYLNASSSPQPAEPEQTPVWKLAFSADTAALIAQPTGSVADSLELPRSIVLQQTNPAEPAPSPGGASVASTLSASTSGSGPSASASLHDMLAAARQELDEKARADSASGNSRAAAVSGDSRHSPPPTAMDQRDAADIAAQERDQDQERERALEEKRAQGQAHAAANEQAEQNELEEADDEADFEPVRASSPTPTSPGSSKGSLTSEEQAAADSPARGVWEKSRAEAWRQVPQSPESPAQDAIAPPSPMPTPSPSPQQQQAISSPRSAGRTPTPGSPHAAMLKSRLPVRSPRRSPKHKPTPAAAAAADASVDSSAAAPATRSLPPRSPARTGGPAVQRRSPARRIAVAEEKVEVLQKQLAAAEATKKVLRAELSMRNSREREGGPGQDPSGEISESDGEIAAILKERVLDGGTLDGVTREEMRSMERLVGEQERMITAYQKENEKTCRDLRDARARVEELEALLDEYAAGNVPITGRANAASAAGGGGDGAGSGHVSPGRQQVEDTDAMQELRLRLQQVQREANERELELKHELDRLRQGKRLADAKFAGIDVPALQREGERLQEVQEELELARDKHREEVTALHKQLKWYVENQEIIDKSDNLVATQKEKIEQLEAELAQGGGKGGKGGKGRGGKGGTGISTRTDAARIKELEAQVGTLKAELEEVLRKKHPNSIPQLIRAARPPMEEHAAHAYMATKIKTLESTLEEKEEEHAKRLRVLRQGFERVKSQHEHRLAQLEVELDAKTKKLEISEKPHMRIKELERQLDDTRSFYTKKLRELNGKLATVPKGRHNKGEKAGAAADKSTAAAPLRQKCKRLETDLSKACAEIRRLQEQSAQDAVELEQQQATVDSHRATETSAAAGKGPRTQPPPSTPSPPRGGGEQGEQQTPPPTAAAMIEMATRQSVTDQSPLFDAPMPPSGGGGGGRGNVQHSPPRHKPQQQQAHQQQQQQPSAHKAATKLGPNHPLEGMDMVQSLLGESKIV